MLGDLNNFHRNHILLKLKIKELLQNISSKNIKTGENGSENSYLHGLNSG